MFPGRGKARSKAQAATCPSACRSGHCADGKRSHRVEEGGTQDPPNPELGWLISQGSAEKQNQ